MKNFAILSFLAPGLELSASQYENRQLKLFLIILGISGNITKFPVSGTKEAGY